MKRCYYISNSYDGAYFVLTDNIDEFVQRMSMYMVNLKRSGKCNHYSFGSLEMSEKEYADTRTQAQQREKSRIQERTQEKNQKSDENNKAPLRLV